MQAALVTSGVRLEQTGASSVRRIGVTVKSPACPALDSLDGRVERIFEAANLSRRRLDA